MYGEQGNKLVIDAKRTQNLPHLPPYATTTVRAVIKEVREIERDANALLAPFASSQASDGTPIKASFNPAEDPATACALMVDHLSMRRNKRCLMAYHKTRTDKLEEMCWAGVDVNEIQQSNVGGLASSRQRGPASSLSAEEEQYVHQYSDLLAAFKGQWTDIDLTGSLEPPRDIFIDVRVLRDAGEIQTEYGSITLTKNSQFYVRQGDVERLIQQGYLQRLS